MDNMLVHEIELYPPETFKTLLAHEVNRSRRYGDSLSLIDLLIETDPSNAQAQHRAEVLAIDALNLQLRSTDIPSKAGSEFLILMPATGAQGARTACERLKKRMSVEQQQSDVPSFKLLVFIGLATLPHDRLVSSVELLQTAAQALQHARTNPLKSVVSFSEIND